jgi:hypothetical protein
MSCHAIGSWQKKASLRARRGQGVDAAARPFMTSSWETSKKVTDPKTPAGMRRQTQERSIQ